MPIGIVGLPDLGLAGPSIGNLHADIAVLSRIGGGKALLHSGGIDEELEGGTGLAHGFYLVVFPRLEIYVTDVGLDVSGLRLHGHEARMQEAHHIAYGVHGGDVLIVAAVIVEQADAMGQVHIVVHRIGLRGVLGHQHPVGFSALGYVFDKMGNDLSLRITPGVAHIAPMVVESSLQASHLLGDCLFGIALHPHVDRGVDFQTVTIGVYIGTVFSYIVGHGFAEVEGLSVVSTLDVVVQLYGQTFERIAFPPGEVVVSAHVFEDDVTALLGSFGMQAGVVGAGRLEQSYQYG